MKLQRRETLKGYLTGLGFSASDAQLDDIIEIATSEPVHVFEPGDIVCIYEGMGEHSYARVLRRKKDNSYRVRPYRYEGKWADYESTVSLYENQLASLEEADDYYRLRRGTS